MKLKIYSSKRGFRAKRAFATLSLVAGLIGVATVGNSSAVSAAGLKDNLVVNPVYQQYMRDVNAGLGDRWVLIPSQYNTIANAEAGRGGGEDLPSSYNLVAEGFGTTQKNQGGDGACWAYATTTAMESYLKKNKNVSIEFAPKQLDYVMSPATQYGTFMAQKYNVNRDLGQGGNFYIASLGLRSDYVVDREDVFYARMKDNDPDLANYDTFRKYNDYNSMFGFGAYTKPMSEAQIFGDKAEYIVSGFERIDKKDSDAVTKIKEKVYTKGAVYVGTYAPETGGCWDAATNTVIDRGTVCDENGGTAVGTESSRGHAMAIVGWDDNYTYTDPGTNTTKTGAFILQNSHGKTSLFSDYNMTTERYMSILREAGELEGRTDAEIQAITEAVAASISSWDAHEFVHLGYDFEKSDNTGSIDFVSITDMVKNDFEQSYDMTQATVELKSDTVLGFKMRGNGEQDLSAIGVDLVFALGENAKITLGVDSNNDGTSEYDQVFNFGPMEAGRKVVQLADPIPVSGDFTILLSVDGFRMTADDDFVVSPLVYATESTGFVPVPDTGGAPNTGVFTKEDGDIKLGGAVATLIGVTIAIVAMTTFKNRKYLHKIKFEKKEF